MACNRYQEMLSEYIDGSLSPGEQTVIEQHLSNCEDCRALRDDMLQLVHFSRQLPLHTPSVAVWTKIQTQIAAGRPQSMRARAAVWFARIESRNFRFSFPQLAAGAIALALVVTASVIFIRRDSTYTSDEQASQSGPRSPIGTTLLSYPDFQQLESRVNQLEQSVDQRKSLLPENLRISYERNLSYINQSLVECRQQLTGNPEDKVSEDLMYDAYREKIRLLEDFAGRFQ